MFNLTRGEEFTAVFAIALVGAATAVVCLVRGDRGKTLEIPLNRSQEISVEDRGEGAREKIVVHVSGEVQGKGAREMPAGSSVKDAIALAVATENADVGALSLAAPLVDGERIVVPSKKTPGQTASPPAEALAGKINVNAASQKELESLPGIGPTLATRIMELRPFKTVDDLIKVRGIGPITLEKIRERVSVK
jgi:competence protein ComEA